MASSFPQLDAPPPQPPGVTGQMGAGASPYAGASAALQKPQGDQGGTNPRGALVTMSDAIKKVLDQMAKMENGFSPFADRIRSLLDAGVGSVMSSGPPGSSPDESKPQVMSPSQKPGEMGAAAPGPGFPG
jgi:hypothetical protein